MLHHADNQTPEQEGSGEICPESAIAGVLCPQKQEEYGQCSWFDHEEMNSGAI